MTESRSRAPLRTASSTDRRRGVAVAVAIALLGGGAAACGDVGGEEWAGTVRDSAGVHVVENPAEGLWEEGEEWTTSVDLVIGGDPAETRPEHQFGRISALTVDDRGTIYVADQQAQEVRAFGPDGGHLRTFGQPGSGPGELGTVLSGIGVVGERLIVADLANQRIALFNPDGTSAGSTRFDITKGLPIRFDGGSREHPLVVQRRFIELTGEDATSVDGDVIVAVGADGTTGDTLLTLPPGLSFSIEGGRQRVRFFEPEPIWDLGRDGWFVMGLNSSYRIEVRDPTGGLVRVVERPFQRRPVREDDKSAILAVIRDLVEEQGIPPQMMDQLMSQYDFAETFPAFGRAVVGPGGTVWVQGIVTPSELPAEKLDPENLAQNLGSPEWDVFDTDGRYLGVVRMPEGFQPMTFSGDLIYGIRAGELGVPTVTRLSLDTG